MEWKVRALDDDGNPIEPKQKVEEQPEIQEEGQEVKKEKVEEPQQKIKEDGKQTKEGCLIIFCHIINLIDDEEQEQSADDMCCGR